MHADSDQLNVAPPVKPPNGAKSGLLQWKDDTSMNVFSPSLEVVNGLLHTFLVVTDHVLVHVGVVGTDVLLSAAIWHGAKTKWWVLLCRLLELYSEEIRRLKERL